MDLKTFSGNILVPDKWIRDLKAVEYHAARTMLAKGIDIKHFDSRHWKKSENLYLLFSILYTIQNFNFKKLLLKQTENNESKQTILLEFWKEIEFNTIKNLKNC